MGVSYHKSGADHGYSCLLFKRRKNVTNILISTVGRTREAVRHQHGGTFGGLFAPLLSPPYVPPGVRIVAAEV